MTGPYNGVDGFGVGQLIQDEQDVRSELGFDPSTADFAVTACAPPHSGAVLDGVDLGSTDGKLTDLGASRSTSHGATTSRFRPDDQPTARR